MAGFAGTGNGIGYKFPSRPDMQYGLRVTLDLGRDEGDALALAGMGDIDLRPEFGGFFNHLITKDWFLATSFRYGADNDCDGAQADSASAGPRSWRDNRGNASLTQFFDARWSLTGAFTVRSLRATSSAARSSPRTRRWPACWR